MKHRSLLPAEAIAESMIAPCGMNCGLCSGYLREKNRCLGCRGDESALPGYCLACKIRNCDQLVDDSADFCGDCDAFPCKRLRQLDKRYQSKYGMSMLENLETLRTVGLAEFVALERTRWACPTCGTVICVHQSECIACGYVWNHDSAPRTGKI